MELPESLKSPAKFGPGVWYCLHSMAFSARSNESVSYFINFVQIILNSLPCEKCRKHALKFFSTHSPSGYSNYKDSRGERIGMFLWTYELHNACNGFLGKPVLDWNLAIKLYEGLRDRTIECKNCKPNLF